MAEIPEKSVDVIFADPPYNLQLEKELWRPNSTRVNGVEVAWDHFSDLASYDGFTQAWLAECQRILKDTGTIWVIGTYHNIFRVGKVLQDLGFWILNDIVWIKNNPMPNFYGVRFTNAHETLIWAQKIKGAKYTFNYHTMKRYNNQSSGELGLQMRSDWRLPICTGKERLRINGEKAHPTQKPEALLERVILASTNPEDIILDPFFGSGTTGAVAKRFGRHWIGIETDKAYISIALARIENVQVNAAVNEIDGDGVKPKIRRIPFLQLLEKGYITAGQTLYFGQQGLHEAIVLADGHIKYGENSGSIHKIGRTILKAPCNGWMTWYYIDEMTGKKEPLDLLRQKVRKEMQPDDTKGNKNSEGR
ncbi:MAG TPA: site-specific DNA-methyltransferase [Anaerolineales bacterium]